MEKHSRPGNNLCKGPEVGSKVRIFEEERSVLLGRNEGCDSGCGWTGQVGRGLIGLPCRPSEGWEVFPKSSREL